MKKIVMFCFSSIRSRKDEAELITNPNQLPSLNLELERTPIKKWNSKQLMDWLEKKGIDKTAVKILRKEIFDGYSIITTSVEELELLGINKSTAEKIVGDIKQLNDNQAILKTSSDAINLPKTPIKSTTFL
ncbi:hypothetical protein ABK040_016308 [Willaertia magna]